MRWHFHPTNDGPALASAEAQREIARQLERIGDSLEEADDDQDVDLAPAAAGRSIDPPAHAIPVEFTGAVTGESCDGDVALSFVTPAGDDVKLRLSTSDAEAVDNAIGTWGDRDD